MCSYNNMIWLYHNLDLSDKEFDEENFDEEKFWENETTQKTKDDECFKG